MMKIIFFGSDNFAERHLRALCRSSHEVLACVTPPDKPRGRGMKVTFADVKAFAVEQGLKVYQPEDIREKKFQEEIKNLGADVFIVIAYGRKLPDELLQIPPQGAVNVHGSLLPKYRGAAPINWAIINGETKTGLTIFLLNNRMDSGDILAQKIVGVAAQDTAVTLREKMMQGGPAFLLETIDQYEQGQCCVVEQAETEVSLAPKLKRETGQIVWEKSAQDIDRLIRGLQPWPGVFTFYKKKQLKILSADVVPFGESGETSPGQVMNVGKEGILVATGQGQALLMKQVHLQDSKPMSAHDFVIGHQIKTGELFLSA